MYFFFDAQGNPSMVKFNDTMYTYVHNLQGDIVGIVDTSGNLVVEYKYDAWGKPLSKTGTLASTLGTLNPFRYRGYVYDEETGLYYLRSRYYNPVWCRFVDSDVLLGQVGALLGHNVFAYCDNNCIARVDRGGRFWETVWDFISLGISIVEVATNPTDPWAWAGLVGDVVDLVPFVTGIGEAARAVKTTVKAVDTVDDVIDSAKAVYKAADAASDIRKATGSYEIIFKSGKNYVGKGGFRRAIVSATEKSVKYGDEAVSIMWKSAPNKEAAFIQEFLMQQKRGVLSSDPYAMTYNLIWGPGKGILGK